MEKQIESILKQDYISPEDIAAYERYPEFVHGLLNISAQYFRDLNKANKDCDSYIPKALSDHICVTSNLLELSPEKREEYFDRMIPKINFFLNYNQLEKFSQVQQFKLLSNNKNMLEGALHGNPQPYLFIIPKLLNQDFAAYLPYIPLEALKLYEGSPYKESLQNGVSKWEYNDFLDTNQTGKKANYLLATNPELTISNNFFYEVDKLIRDKTEIESETYWQYAEKIVDLVKTNGTKEHTAKRVLNQLKLCMSEKIVLPKEHLMDYIEKKVLNNRLENTLGVNEKKTKRMKI